MIKIIGLWEGIRTRPTLYIGKKSIYGLQCLIQGVWVAENMLRQKVLDVDWHAFNAWVAKKVRRQNNKPSFQFALLKCNNDDEKAFDLWMKWYDEYERKVLGGKKEEGKGEGAEGDSDGVDPHLY
jgi:hypothetical protein